MQQPMSTNNHKPNQHWLVLKQPQHSCEICWMVTFRPEIHTLALTLTPPLCDSSIRFSLSATKRNKPKQNSLSWIFSPPQQCPLTNFLTTGAIKKMSRSFVTGLEAKQTNKTNTPKLSESTVIFPTRSRKKFHWLVQLEPVTWPSGVVQTPPTVTREN